MAANIEANRVVRTSHGEYLVQGLDCFAVAGPLANEIAAAVDKHYAARRTAPDAVVWDDCVLEFRSNNLSFSLLRVFVPFADPFAVAALDNRARCAVRVSTGSDFELPDVNAALQKLAAAKEANIAHAPGLFRFIGWPEQAPLTGWVAPRPQNRARSISVIMNYRDKSAVTIESLAQIASQAIEGGLELVLIDNQSRPREREAVEEAVHQLFGERPNVQVRHVRYDAPFNHSYQCNIGASTATGDVLLMMSNDCRLLEQDTLQTLADWALEPGVGGVMPRIVGSGGTITSAGVSILPGRDDKRDAKDENRALRVQDCEVDYLSRAVRQTVAVTFACAAMSRKTWFAAGGLDAIAFPTDYNDADFSLRCTRLGLKHMYIGSVEAHHQPGRGDRRTRDQTDTIHAELLRRHRLADVPANNPYGIRMRRLPEFNIDAANQVLDLIRLYKQAHNARSADGSAAGDVRFLRSFEALVAAADLARDATLDPLDLRESVARHNNLFDKIRVVGAEYIRIASIGQLTSHQIDSFNASHSAMQRLAEMAHRDAKVTYLPPADSASAARAERQRFRQALGSLLRPVRSSQSRGDPDPGGEFFSFSDKGFDTAARRLLVFADAMGPTQQSVFLTGLNRARRAGEIAVRIITEADISRLVSLRGDGHLGSHIQQTIAFTDPTTCIFSRYGDWKSQPILAEQLARADMPTVFLIDDDLFHIGADSGIEFYREARNPRRVFTLARIAATSDLVVASTPVLAKRIEPFAGGTPIVCAGMLSGAQPPSGLVRSVNPRIGYFASAAHDADLAMIVPALLRLRRDYPSVAIDIRGPVAAEAASLSLGDGVHRDPQLIDDYPRFRKALAGYEWTIGLAPLRDTAFNATKSPIKWLEYSEAGIATIASNIEPYRAAGRQGALLLSGRHDWYGRIVELLSREERRRELVVAAGRVVSRDHNWQDFERRLLAVFERTKTSQGRATMAVVGR